MSSLSTHVLNTASGRPASGVCFRLFDGQTLLFSGVTNDDGRCSALADQVLHQGTYRLEFDIADYFDRQGIQQEEVPFLTIVPIIFSLQGEGHVHVPLLVAPYGYSTYRGS